MTPNDIPPTASPAETLPPAPSPAAFQRDTRCPRCGGQHDKLDYQPLSNGRAFGDNTHWGTCPATNEPILLVRVG